MSWVVQQYGVNSLTWPDFYFIQGAIACSISARTKNRVWSRSQWQVVQTPPSRLEVLIVLKVREQSILETMHFLYQRRFEVAKQSTPLVGSEVSERLATGNTTRPYFCMGAYTTNDSALYKK